MSHVDHLRLELRLACDAWRQEAEYTAVLLEKLMLADEVDAGQFAKTPDGSRGFATDQGESRARTTGQDFRPDLVTEPGDRPIQYAHPDDHAGPADDDVHPDADPHGRADHDARRL